MADQDRLQAALRAFAATMANDYELTDVLLDVCDHVTEVLEATGAGVSLIDEQRRFRFATASSEAVVAAEQVQEDTQDGPCRHALDTGAPVAIAAVDDLEPWPAYQAAARDAGMEAVLAVPMSLGDQHIGAVDVYQRGRRTWSESDVSAARVLADVATAYVIRTNATAVLQEVNDHLQRALDSRVAIEQAKGMIAAELGLTVDDAFEAIRRHARERRVTVRSVAQSVIDEGPGVVGRR
jgi:GAF domain-containing protein